MAVTEQIDQKHQEDLQRLRGFRLLDDDFLTKCFEGDTASIELVLQIVLEKPDLKVLDVRTQVFVENLLNRSVRLDILATDNTGAKLNVEVQRSDKGAGRKHPRQHKRLLHPVPNLFSPACGKCRLCPVLTKMLSLCAF